MNTNAKRRLRAEAFRYRKMGLSTDEIAVLLIKEAQTEQWTLGGDEIDKLAEEAGARDPAGITEEEENGDVEASLLVSLREKLGIPVAEVIKRGRTQANFDISLDGGIFIQFGTSYDLLNFRKAKAAIHDATGIVIGCQPKEWDGIVRLMTDLARIEELPSELELMRDRLQNYLANRPPVQLTDESSCAGDYPVTAQGHIFIRTSHFVTWLDGKEKFDGSQRAIGLQLRRLGWIPQFLACPQRNGGKKAVRYWRAPDGWE